MRLDVPVTGSFAAGTGPNLPAMDTHGDMHDMSEHRSIMLESLRYGLAPVLAPNAPVSPACGPYCCLYWPRCHHTSAAVSLVPWPVPDEKPTRHIRTPAWLRSVAEPTSAANCKSEQLLRRIVFYLCWSFNWLTPRLLLLQSRLAAIVSSATSV